MTIGISPKDFWEMTWYEYHLVCKSKEHQNDIQWTHTRFIGQMITPMYSNKMIPGEKIVPLPRIDKNRPVARGLTDEEFEILKAKGKRILNLKDV